MSCADAGQAVLKLKTPRGEGTPHMVMPPLAFMQRPAVMVPRPRLHLLRFRDLPAPGPSRTRTLFQRSE